MDRVLLNKMLECDYTLSNVFMRTCKRFHRYVTDNKHLMEKLLNHYQPILEKEIHFELERLFTVDTNHNPKGINLKVKNIENILINDSHDDNKKKSVKVSEIILLGKNGIVLKSFSLKKVDKLFKDKIISVREISRLCDVYLKSIGYRINDNRNERIMKTLLNNFLILLKTIIERSEEKYTYQVNFPANTYLKYFILMIAVLYVRYTFMK